MTMEPRIRLMEEIMQAEFVFECSNNAAYSIIPARLFKFSDSMYKVGVQPTNQEISNITGTESWVHRYKAGSTRDSM